MKRLFLLLFVFLFFLMGNVFAATYYVSNSLGNDNNDGLSPNRPLKRAPGMNGFTGNVVLSPGDVVYFLNIDVWNFSSGSYFLDVAGGVTYDGSSWGNGGRAKFIATTNINGGGIGAPFVRIVSDHQTYPTIFRGFEIDGNNFLSSGITVNWPASFRNLSGASKIIDNCIIHDVFSNASAGTYSYGVLVGSVNGFFVKNISIINSTVYNTPRSGIAIYPSKDFDNNIPPKSNKVYDVFLIGNTVFNAGRDQDSVGACLIFNNEVINVLAEYNTLYNCYAGISFQLSEPYISSTRNAILRYNLIYNNSRHGFWAGISNTSNLSFEFYNNLVFNNGYNGIIFDGYYYNLNAKVYNNVIFNNGLYTSEEIILRTFRGINNNISFVNNLIYARSGKIPLVDETGNKINYHSNNLYYRPDMGVLVKNGNFNYNVSNIFSWENYVLFSNPQFKNLSNLPKKFVYTNKYLVDSDGLSLLNISPAIDAGLNLGSNYALSFNGVLRPQGSGWDIGAFEYVGGSGCFPADVDCNGCISFSEISLYVNRWFNGFVSFSDVNNAIVRWLNGGC